MISLPANWTAAALKGTSKPVWLAELHVDSATSYKFASGDISTTAIPASLVSVSPVNRRLDLITREPSASSAVLVFLRDKQWHDLLYDYSIVGGFMDLKIGFKDLSTGDFVQHASMIVDKVQITDTTVELTCKDPERKLADQKVTWQWVNMHPLQAARRIFTLTMPTTRQNATSMDPTTYSADISHFVISRGMFSGSDSKWLGPVNGILTPKSGSELVGDIARILGGAFFANEDGEIEFKKFNPSNSIEDTWTEDDYTDLEFGPLYEILYNKVSVASHPFQYDNQSEAHELVYSESDDTSQAAYPIVVPAGTDADNVREHQIKTDWIAGITLLTSDMTAVSPGVSGTFTTAGCWAHAFCGTAWRDIQNDDYYSHTNYGTSTQFAYHQVSSDRPVYLKIDNEIIKCDQLTFAYDIIQSVYDEEETNEWSTRAKNFDAPCGLTWRVAERGACGTDAAAHTSSVYTDSGGWNSPTLVYDVTIQRWVTDLLLERFSNGAITARCRTGMDKYGLQRGDFVGLTVSADRFRAKSRSGLSAVSTKFEITGKSLDPTADPPGILWELVEADYSARPAISTTIDARAGIPGFSRTGAYSGPRGDATDARVISGFDVASTSAFVLTMDPGEAAVDPNIRTAIAEAAEFTIGASKDAYVVVDVLSGGIRVEEVANGAAEPDIGAFECFAQKVVTDGAGITSTIEHGRRSALTGVKLHDDTVAAASINKQQEMGRNLNLNPSFTLRTRG